MLVSVSFNFQHVPKVDLILQLIITPKQVNVDEMQNTLQHELYSLLESKILSPMKVYIRILCQYYKDILLLPKTSKFAVSVSSRLGLK